MRLRRPTARPAGPAALAALAVLGVLLAGCFDLEESVDLDRNLTGKASFSATVDLGAMVVPMLMMQRQMSGKTGDPTPAEIAAARQDMIAQQKSDPSKAPSVPKREEIEKGLPPGVRLLDVGTEDKGDLKLRMHVLFGFDDLNKLMQIRDPKKEEKAAEGAGGGPAGANANLFDKPFAGLTLKDEGKTVLVSTEFGNPVSAGAASQSLTGGEATPEAKKTMEQIFQGLRIRFKLTTPLEVVDSNATRRDGKTLVWDYDAAAIEKLADAKQPLKVWARLRR